MKFAKRTHQVILTILYDKVKLCSGKGRKVPENCARFSAKTIAKEDFFEKVDDLKLAKDDFVAFLVVKKFNFARRRVKKICRG